jgi:hypothetical protein
VQELAVLASWLAAHQNTGCYWLAASELAVTGLLHLNSYGNARYASADVAADTLFSDALHCKCC